jgi:hypothetical protein
MIIFCKGYIGLPIFRIGLDDLFVVAGEWGKATAKKGTRKYPQAELKRSLTFHRLKLCFDTSIESMGDKLDKPGDHGPDIILRAMSPGKIIQPAVLGESTKHGGHRQVKMPVNFPGWCIGVNQGKFQIVNISNLRKEPLMHFFDKMDWLGKSPSDQLGKTASGFCALGNFLSDRKDQGVKDLVGGQGPARLISFGLVQ